MTTLTAMVGATQLLSSDMVLDLQRDRQLLLAGEWRRLVMPMFGAGLAGEVFSYLLSRRRPAADPRMPLLD